MNTIKVTGVREPLKISFDKAEKLQKMKTEVRADEQRNITVRVAHFDGTWVGKLSDIHSIFQEKPKTEKKDEFQKQMQKERLQFSKMTPEARGNAVGRFKLWWGMHYGKTIGELPPKKLIDKVKVKQIAWYKKNTQEIYPNRVPVSIYESVVPKTAVRKHKDVVKRMPEVTTYGENVKTVQDDKNHVQDKKTPETAKTGVVGGVDIDSVVL